MSSGEVAENPVPEVFECPAAEQDVGDRLTSLAVLAGGVGHTWYSSGEEKIA